MTKAQALALIVAIEGQQVNASANMLFDAAHNETWTVTIPPAQVLTGPQISALVAYCAANGLAFSAQFAYLGIS